MKIPVSWLKEYFETSASLTELCDTLTGIGLEVEEVLDEGAKLAPFKCVHVLEAKPHPNADKLKVCRVDTGKEILQIVCGASNARSGMKTILAPIGAVMPVSGAVLKKSKLREVESCGMLCSATELGIDIPEVEHGIIDVDMSVPVGTPVAEIYHLGDPVIDLNITPNRGDCLGIYGVARDLQVTGIGKMTRDLWSEAAQLSQQLCTDLVSPISVEIQTDQCFMFSGCYLKGVHNDTSPEWLQERLRSVGIKSISTIVDISNYVMYITGKPLHCYDADQIQGQHIIVREAKEGEELQALNEVTYQLDANMVVVADTQKPLCLGGVIGGIGSSTTLQTQNIFLESAVFEPVAIAKTGRKLCIDTEARHRYERGVDVQMNNVALQMAAKMVQELCGGEMGQVVECRHAPASKSYYSFDQRVIQFVPAKANDLLGTHISSCQMLQTLARLGCDIDITRDPHRHSRANGVESNGMGVNVLTIKSTEELAKCIMDRIVGLSGNGVEQDLAQRFRTGELEAEEFLSQLSYDITVPLARNDLHIFADLTEEIIRFYGLDNIVPKPLPLGDVHLEAKLRSEQNYNLRRLLTFLGYTETCTFSFIPKDRALLFTAQYQPELELLNPITVEMDYMRGSILPSLLEAYHNNVVRGGKNVSFFEMSTVFHGVKPQEQLKHLSGIRVGQTHEKNLYHTERPVDFFDLKGDVQQILGMLGVDTEKLSLTTSELPYYHPARSAVWKMGKQPLAYFGELHPKITHDFEINERVYAFEIVLSNLPERKRKTTTKQSWTVSDYQEVRRDFAFLLDKSVEVGRIPQIIRQLKQPLIREVQIFDVYLPAGEAKKSVAFSVVLQAADHTLSSEEINGVSESIIYSISQQLSGELRDK